MDIMCEPVVTRDGHVYEKEAILKWLAKTNKSPLTNCVIDKEVIPCYALKNLIQRFIEEHSKPVSNPASKHANKQAGKTNTKKRQPSAYNMYVKQQFPIIQKAHPHLKPYEVIQIIAQEWKHQKK